ncbi:hypothetical protein AB0L53_42210 [Nonomuraea sp. NPDC052129]|uniref:hypothetical protein n=1 Tax=Nonomuraea sp. NPDC052129 TaxID=3154651 RepID=UPI0034287BAC
MPHPTDLYDLLVSIDLDSEEYSGFHLLWAEDMGGNELCRRLGGEPASAFRCDINNLARPEAEPGPAMWAGTANGWAQALLFNLYRSPLSFLPEVSRDTRAPPHPPYGWQAESPGREIDAKWLSAVHSNYSLKSS